MSPWTGFDLTALVVIRTDCAGSCKSNYYTIKTFWPWWVCDVLLTELVCLLLDVLLRSMVKLYSPCWYVDYWLSYWPWWLFNVLKSRTKEQTNNNTLRQNRWFILSLWILILYADLVTCQQHLCLEYNLQVDTVFWNLWILSGFALFRDAANKEAIEQVISSGYLILYLFHEDYIQRGATSSSPILLMWMSSTFYGHHNDLVNRYGISASHNMSTDMTCPPFLWWWRNWLPFPSSRAHSGLLMQQY